MYRNLRKKLPESFLWPGLCYNARPEFLYAEQKWTVLFFICCRIVLRTYNIDRKVSLNGDRGRSLAKDHMLYWV